MSENANEITATLVHNAATLARIEGKLETLGVQVEAGDRHTAQLVELLRGQHAHLVDRVTELKTEAGVQDIHLNAAISSVRVDLERQLKEHAADSGHKGFDERIESLEATRIRQRVWLPVIAAIGAGVTSTIAAIVVRVVT